MLRIVIKGMKGMKNRELFKLWRAEVGESNIWGHSYDDGDQFF